MPNSSRVTIVVPSYNYGHLIGETLESVRKQTHRDWECLVVDDGSTDDTREVVKSFVARDARIKYIYQPNAGLSAARNTGIKQSAGSYLQFLDADDLLEADKLARHVEYLDQHEDADIVYGDARYFTSGDKELRTQGTRGARGSWIPKISGCGGQILSRLVQSNIMVVHAALLRRTVFEAAGYFDEELSALEDWEFWIRCAAHDMCFAYCEGERTLALIRTHPKSMSGNAGNMHRMRLLMRRKIEGYVGDEEARRINREWAIQDEALSGVFEMADGGWSRGVRRVLRSAAHSRRMGQRIKWLAVVFVSLFVPKRQLLRLLLILRLPKADLPFVIRQKAKDMLRTTRT